MRESTKPKGRVSLDDDDAMDTGLFSSGPARIKESIFTDYDYGGNAKAVAVWLITFERDGENDYEQPYSLGKGWKVKDGELIPTMGQTGLPKSCNAMRHLVKPLKAALKDADMLDDFDFKDGDPDAIVGLDVVLRRVEQEKRAFGAGGGSRRGGDGKDEKERSILEIEEVTGKSDGKKTSKKAKPSRDADDEKPRSKKRGDDDDDDDAPKKKRKASDDDDDEDEAPKKKSRRDDDDDDEKPKRGGKGKPADDDDADEETIKEEGIETLIEVLQDGPVEFDDLEGLVKKEVKGHKHAKEIVEWCVDTDNLELEKGWTYAKDKKTKVWSIELA